MILSQFWACSIKYLKDEKSFQHEIKSIYHFQTALIEANKTKFFGKWECYMEKHFIPINCLLAKPWSKENGLPF